MKIPTLADGEFEELRMGYPSYQYEPHPDRPLFLVRIEEDGARTIGRFVRRQFQTVRSK